jgi:hypothetical protein
VVPWIETAKSCGIDLEAPQRAAPQRFKSHLSYDALPKGARYVVSLRDPKDAMVSMFRFMEGWWIEPGQVSIGDFVHARIALRGSGRDYWHHLISWWQQRENPDVLLVSYEHMSADPVANIRKLAAFCGFALDDELLALTLDHSSLGFMRRYKDRFDDLLMRQLSERRCNLPHGSDWQKFARARWVATATRCRRELSPSWTACGPKRSHQNSASQATPNLNRRCAVWCRLRREAWALSRQCSWRWSYCSLHRFNPRRAPTIVSNTRSDSLRLRATSFDEFRTSPSSAPHAPACHLARTRRVQMGRARTLIRE